MTNLKVLYMFCTALDVLVKTLGAQAVRSCCWLYGFPVYYHSLAVLSLKTQSANWHTLPHISGLCVHTAASLHAGNGEFVARGPARPREQQFTIFGHSCQ